MKNCLLAMIVIFGIGIIGCKTDETDNDWERVYLSSVNDIHGVWESSFSVNVPAAGDYNTFFATIFGVPIPPTSVSYESYQVEYVENSSFVSIETKTVFDKLLNDTINMNPEYARDSLWDNLIAFYDPFKSSLNMTIEKYYTTAEFKENVNDIDFSAFFLHKNRKQLKMIIPFSQTYKQEVIFNKTQS